MNRTVLNSLSRITARNLLGFPATQADACVCGAAWCFSSIGISSRSSSTRGSSAQDGSIVTPHAAAAPAAAAGGAVGARSNQRQQHAARSSILHPVDLDELLLRHGGLAAEVQAAKHEQQQQQPQGLISDPASLPSGGSDPDLLLDLDEDLKRRLEAVGVDLSIGGGRAAAITTTSETSSGGAVANAWATRRKAAPPLAAAAAAAAAAGAGATSPEADAPGEAEIGSIAFNKLPWPRERDVPAQGAAPALLQRLPRRHAPGFEEDPWAPQPPEAAIRARLPAAIRRIMQEAQRRQAERQGIDAWGPDGGAWGPRGASGAGGGGGGPGGGGGADCALDPSAAFVALRRLPLQQLQQLLQDAELATFGSKSVLLTRITAELSRQQQQQQQDAAGGAPSRAVAALPWVDEAQTPHHPQQHHHHHHRHHQQQQQQGAHPDHSRVSAAAAARGALLASLADVREMCGWLAAARAGDLCVVDVRGRAGATKYLVVATAASQQHAHACAEAVRWRLMQKAETHLLRQGRGGEDGASGEDSEGCGREAGGGESPGGAAPQKARAAGAAAAGLEARPGPLALQVAGGPSSDWAALDAGPVSVHVLTDRARRYYDLEGLWGAPGRVFAASAAGGGRLLTADTIQ